MIAVNEAWRLCPWAQVLYAQDNDWWLHRRGVPGFAGAKFTASPEAAYHYPELHLRRLVRVDRIVAAPGALGYGGNSGFQAVNLAVHLGAIRIALVGFDMRTDLGLHWHGAHPGALRNPGPSDVVRWRRVLDAAARDLVKLGVQLVNCSPVSALTAYPFMTLAEFLA